MVASSEKYDADILQSAIEVFLDVLRAGTLKVQELGELTQQGKENSVFSEQSVKEYVGNWMQASWETIVEASVLWGDMLFLLPYGDGAEFFEEGSRVGHPKAEATHAVHIIPQTENWPIDKLTGNTVKFPPNGFILDEFVTLTPNGWYSAEAPLDCVLIECDGSPERKLDMVVGIQDVRFVLRRLD